ncbi:hypothetical protein HUK80_16450 [Flavobacterium sp. MAH-1]|uniref:Beta-carotene 15,15'-monooxygenase n=1 Tax=Flavobacterium agri TaxID=2743471 RepID=A0A7Y8Y4R4_9FLAO|nr:hypothetical protein [Flavobacterium agri]NUY82498.1 hypothetical protein [Flavobacterium agri]NYA72522.1 hypothetical protein [Flavobacterium agri]
MDELDLLKKDWKRNENAFNQISEKEIYAMLHKKSSSIVKWILIISILEVLLWTAMGMLPNTDEYLDKMGHAEYADYFQWFNYFNYSVILVFIYLFYRNYVAISTTASTKKLMDDIIRTRKTVNYYVWYNLSMIVLSFIVGFIIAFICNPDVDQLRQKVQEDGRLMALLIGFLVVIVAVIAFLAWLFYRLVYGIFLRKLLANYKELKKIDL